MERVIPFLKQCGQVAIQQGFQLARWIEGVLRAAGNR